MRALFLILFTVAIPMTSTSADEIDYGKFARAERKQLAKCFTDMLTARSATALANT
jgi:hypothetical protein